MKKSLLLFIISLIGLASSFQLQNCATTNIGYSLFDLCAFTQGQPFNRSDLDDILVFSLGNNNVNDCSDHGEVWSTYETEGTCYNIAEQAPTYSLINQSNSSQGIAITFPQGNGSDNATTTSVPYQLIVNLECDTDITDTDQIEFTWSQQTSESHIDIITLTGSSNAACPVVSLDVVVNFFNQNKAIFAGGFGFIGLILLLFGFRLIKLAVFLIPTVLTGLALAYLLFAVVTINHLWAIYAIMGGSLLVGVIIGVLSLWFKRFGYFFIGAAVGVVIGFLLYNAVLSPFIKDFYGVGPLYLTLGISGIVGGGIGMCIFESILILATCLIGSFLIVRTAAEFIGGFPAENAVAEGLEDFDIVTYAYLTVIIVLAGVGIYIQVRQKRYAKSAKSAKKQEEAKQKEVAATEDVYSEL